MPLEDLLGLLLAKAMEIWDRECGPFRPPFPVFIILGQVENTIFPWGKRPSWQELAILVVHDAGSIVLGFGICSSRLGGRMQHTVVRMSPTFACVVPRRVTPPSEHSKQPAGQQAEPQCTGLKKVSKDGHSGGAWQGSAESLS